MSGEDEIKMVLSSFVSYGLYLKGDCKMRKGIKYALLFTGGVAVGIGICGASLISYAFSDEDIRDGIKNKISRKVDKALYGERNRVTYSSRVSYRKNRINYRYEFDSKDVIFETRKSAEEAKTELEDTIFKYGFATVADLYYIANLDCDYTKEKYGWTSLKDVEVKRSRHGYFIDIPNPLPIN